VADIHTLHGLWDPMKTEAHRGKEEQARSVDWLISLHVTVLARSVVGLAEGDTRAAVGHQASFNGHAASEEVVGPFLRTLWALVVDGSAGIAQNLVEAVLPVIDIMVVDWASVSWSWSWGTNWSSVLIDRSRHCFERGYQREVDKIKDK